MWKICRLLCLGCHDFYSAKQRCTSHNAKQSIQDCSIWEQNNCQTIIPHRRKKITAVELGLQRLGECRRLQDRQSTLSSEGFSMLARKQYFSLARSSSKQVNKYAYKRFSAVMSLYISLWQCTKPRVCPEHKVTYQLCSIYKKNDQVYKFRLKQCCYIFSEFIIVQY